MAKREIRTHNPEVSCGVCGRTLLRGEDSETFLAGSTRHTVCELCQPRARQSGWIPEKEATEIRVSRPRRVRGSRSLFNVFRRERDDTGRTQPEEVESESAAVYAGEIPPLDDVNEPPPRGDVRAVPSSLELRIQRALELFNSSNHVRTIAGITRSLGPPAVGINPSADESAIVRVAVMWELSWYRFEVDLAHSDVRQIAHGSELSELPLQEREANALATDDGTLVFDMSVA